MSDNFPTITAELLAAKLGENGSSNGVACHFIKLSELVGIKLYIDENTRDETYSRQWAAAKYGLAPQVFGTGQLDQPLELGSHKRLYRYYYLTEVAEVLTLRAAIDLPNNQRETLLQDTTKLVANLQNAIGWGFHDAHTRNVGYLNGKLVCIDFGED